MAAAGSSYTLSLSLIVFLIITCCCSSASSFNSSSSSSSSSFVVEQREFDYFKLALQWPPTYCRKTKHCCSSNACCRGANAPPGFTIHGLWPDYNNGSWPACCTHASFDEKEISSLRDALDTYWPSLSCRTISNCFEEKGSFWAHEFIIDTFEILPTSFPTSANTLLCLSLSSSKSDAFLTVGGKHGTCSAPVVRDEYNYFLTGLNVYFKYNVTEVLSEAGYVPSNSEMYPVGGIISAVQNAFHATPELVCANGALEELHLCFYKDFKLRDCAASPKDNSVSSCPKYISLPTYTSLGLKHISNGADLPRPAFEGM